MGSDQEILDGPLTGLKRVLGRIKGIRPGPTLVSVGGLHGNEPAGVLALRRVLDRLQGSESQLSGEFVAITGNRAALAQGRRYLERDLNRSWNLDRIEGLQNPEAPSAGEDQEQRELLEALDATLIQARGPVFLLDLHTTSGCGEPFSAIMDRPPNRTFALGIPVPMVLGFGELVDGTFFGYLTGRGITSMVFEGGQHEDPASVPLSEAAIWLGLAGAGVIQESDFPEVGEGRRLLLEAAGGLPPAFEIRHRHPVDSGDGFRMEPGFKNFESVAAGQVLAQDEAGVVRSPDGGRLLLPLYQAQGEDGFFLIGEVQLP